MTNRDKMIKLAAEYSAAMELIDLGGWATEAAAVLQAETQFHNPKPVAAHLQPIFDENSRVGLLLIQRGDNLGWAFPSGWIENTDGSAETAARREFDEETGIVTHNGDLFYSEIIPSGIIMLFSRCPVALSIDELIFFKPNREALAVRVAYEPEELVFSSHTKAMKRWFASGSEVMEGWRTRSTSRPSSSTSSTSSTPTPTSPARMSCSS